MDVKQMSMVTVRNGHEPQCFEVRADFVHSLALQVSPSFLKNEALLVSFPSPWQNLTLGNMPILKHAFMFSQLWDFAVRNP